MGNSFGAICPGKPVVIRNSVGDLFVRLCAAESVFVNCVDGTTLAAKQLTMAGAFPAAWTLGIG
jgi:hypothetical protein